MQCLNVAQVGGAYRGEGNGVHQGLEPLTRGPPLLGKWIKQLGIQSIAARQEAAHALRSGRRGGGGQGQRALQCQCRASTGERRQANRLVHGQRGVKHPYLDGAELGLGPHVPVDVLERMGQLGGKNLVRQLLKRVPVFKPGHGPPMGVDQGLQGPRGAEPGIGHLQKGGRRRHGNKKRPQGLQHIAHVDGTVRARSPDMHMHAIGGKPFGQESKALGELLRAISGRHDALVPELGELRASPPNPKPNGLRDVAQRLGQRHRLREHGIRVRVHGGVDLHGGKCRLQRKTRNVHPLFHNLPEPHAGGRQGAGAGAHELELKLHSKG